MQKCGIFITHHKYNNTPTSRIILQTTNRCPQQIKLKNFAKVNFMHYIRINMTPQRSVKHT